MAQSNIEWTQTTWNPTAGCTKISAGCKNCYAETMHARLTAMRVDKYSKSFREVRAWEPHLELPLTWRRPRMVFVNSMSDLFHDDLPVPYIKRVFEVMHAATQHTFQVLTKRSERLLALSRELEWSPNIWMGVSVEDQAQTRRIAHLVDVPAKVRFLSMEPLVGPVEDLPLQGIHWVIAGGESGHLARPMDLTWARHIRDQCRKEGVPFFLKQLGGRQDKQGKDKALLDGRLWREFPP